MDKQTSQIAVLIVAGGAGIAFVLWGLSLFVPALGLAAGLAWSVGTTGTAVGVSVAPVVVEAAAYGLAGAGVGSAIYVVVNIARRAQREPFQWLLPILGVVNGFLVQVCSDYWPGPKPVWLVLSTISALMVVASGALYTRESLVLKVLGFILNLLVPLVVLLCITSVSTSSIETAIQEVPLRAWLLVSAMALVAVAIAVLAKLLEHLR